MAKFKKNGVPRAIWTDENIIADATLVLDNSVTVVMDDDCLSKLHSLARSENTNRAAILRAMIRNATISNL